MVRFVLVAIFQSAGLCVSLLSSYLKALTGRRKAMGRFRKALVEEGVPPQVAREIAESYPEIPIPWRFLRQSTRLISSSTENVGASSTPNREREGVS